MGEMSSPRKAFHHAELGNDYGQRPLIPVGIMQRSYPGSSACPTAVDGAPCGVCRANAAAETVAGVEVSVLEVDRDRLVQPDYD